MEEVDLHIVNYYKNVVGIKSGIPFDIYIAIIGDILFTVGSALFIFPEEEAVGAIVFMVGSIIRLIAACISLQSLQHNSLGEVEFYMLIIANCGFAASSLALYLDYNRIAMFSAFFWSSIFMQLSSILFIFSIIRATSLTFLFTSFLSIPCHLTFLGAALFIAGSVMALVPPAEHKGDNIFFMLFYLFYPNYYEITYYPFPKVGAYLFLAGCVCYLLSSILELVSYSKYVQKIKRNEVLKNLDAEEAPINFYGDQKNESEASDLFRQEIFDEDKALLS